MNPILSGRLGIKLVNKPYTNTYCEKPVYTLDGQLVRKFERRDLDIAFKSMIIKGVRNVLELHNAGVTNGYLGNRTIFPRAVYILAASNDVDVNVQKHLLSFDDAMNLGGGNRIEITELILADPNVLGVRD